jgi:hypothetical protein
MSLFGPTFSVIFLPKRRENSRGFQNDFFYTNPIDEHIMSDELEEFFKEHYQDRKLTAEGP